jgi:predicted AlkP superfamily pyrophosphatase or phosphodiesterase
MMRFRLRDRLGMFLLWAAASLLSGACFAQTAAPVIVSEHGPNTPQQISKHYVVLVSLDGFRYDYAKLYQADHLLKLAAKGASAPDGMIPSYPTVTFPNHLTLVTGLYPEHHGIVENTFYDPSRNETYSYRSETAADGTWYGGTPLWVLAEQQGMRSACYFWPGSEAEIQGQRPTYYLHYDIKVPNEQRVQQVLDWLRLPPEKRPHFIALYFSDVDHAGHQFGPGSAEVKQQVHDIDEVMGKLASGLETLKLPVDLIVLADHGMAQLGEFLNLLQYDADIRSQAKTVGSQIYANSEADAQKIYEALQGKSEKFLVFRRAQMPGTLHDDANLRSGDPMIVATAPYPMGFADPNERSAPSKGGHGFDPARIPEMKALFLAEGPDIRENLALPSFENVNVYPLIAHLLGLDIAHLKTPSIDGDLKVLRPALKEP